MAIKETTVNLMDAHVKAYIATGRWQNGVSGICLTFRKVRASSRSYGRGMDNCYTPAQYGVFRKGVQVGVIHGSRVRYMESPLWTICDALYGRMMSAGSLGDAKDWVRANARRFVK